LQRDVSLGPRIARQRIESQPVAAALRYLERGADVEKRNPERLVSDDAIAEIEIARAADDGDSDSRRDHADGVARPGALVRSIVALHEIIADNVIQASLEAVTRHDGLEDSGGILERGVVIGGGSKHLAYFEPHHVVVSDVVVDPNVLRLGDVHAGSRHSLCDAVVEPSVIRELGVEAVQAVVRGCVVSKLPLVGASKREARSGEAPDDEPDDAAAADATPVQSEDTPTAMPFSWAPELSNTTGFFPSRATSDIASFVRLTAQVCFASKEQGRPVSR
jgi:hypothetical protein